MSTLSKKCLIASLLFYSFGFSYGIQAQGCKSATAIVTDIFNNYGQVLAKFGCSLTKQDQCLNTVSTYSKMTTDMVKYWNSRSGTTAWATIGPRMLEYNTNYTGKIVSTGGRMFISVIPSNKKELEVSIEELDGKGKVSVVICKIDKNGTYMPLATKWFNDNSDRKSNKREKRNFTVKGVKGHLISVHFDGKSATNTFQYKIKIK